MNIKCLLGFHKPKRFWRWIKIKQKDGYEIYYLCENCKKKL